MYFYVCRISKDKTRMSYISFVYHSTVQVLNISVCESHVQDNTYTSYQLPFCMLGKNKINEGEQVDKKHKLY